MIKYLLLKKTVRREKSSVFFAYFLFQKKVQLVLIRARVHPFPFRTRKLSSLLPKILVWRRTGKIGNANTDRPDPAGPGLFDASLAQSVEHAAVNRRVVGSSPTGGAISGLPPTLTASRSFQITCVTTMGL